VLDLVLKNGTIVDGTGRPRFQTDIGILDGKIVALNDLSQAEAVRSIDVSSLVVSPGFIDMHSHSDLSILSNPRAQSSISQGITTEVIGSCGWSMAPVKEETRRSVLEKLLKGLINKDAFESPDWNWNSFGQFMDAVEKAGTGVNLVPQVGQSLLRAHVVGTENRAASRGEIEAMKSLLKEAMEDGAWGMSTGRSYKPGGFASTDEITALARVVASYGGIYATHMKSEGDELFSAVEEVIHIAEQAEVRVEISHHKAVGKKNFGKVQRSLEMIDKARSRGLQIYVDVYPYEFAQVSSLIRLFPMELWGSTFLSNEEIEEKLKDSSFVEKLKSSPELNLTVKRAKNYLVMNAPSAPDLEGRILEDYVEEKGLNITDFLIDLMCNDGFSVHVAWPINEEDVHTVIRANFATGGTDAFTLDRPIWPTPIHPRHYGTFPRIVGRFVRNKLFSLEEAVKKCTWLPAKIMGIPNRGCIDIGFWADLVIFDPQKLTDTATAKDPYQRAVGIEYVLVNGKVALEKGEIKPVFSGKVLRRR